MESYTEPVESPDSNPKEEVEQSEQQQVAVAATDTHSRQLPVSSGKPAKIGKNKAKMIKTSRKNNRRKK